MIDQFKDTKLHYNESTKLKTLNNVYEIIQDSFLDFNKLQGNYDSNFMISFAETYKLELKQLERTILDLLRDPILKTLPQLFTLIDILTGNNFFDKF